MGDTAANQMKAARARYQVGLGTADPSLQDHLITQALPGLLQRSEGEQMNAVGALLAALEALAPSDAAGYACGANCVYA